MAWEDPREASLLWVQDRLHWPEPVTPLFGSLLVDGSMARGTSAGLAAGGHPLEYRMRRINTYVYTAAVALAPSAGAPAGSVQDLLAPTPRSLSELWATEWLPEIKEHLGLWQELDLPGASMTQLMVYLDETLTRFERLWDLHVRVTSPAHLAVSLFEDAFQDLLPGQEPLAAYKLLQGFDNKVLETDRMLWQLSRQVSAEPRVREVFTTYAAGDVLTQLERVPEGQAFIRDVRGYVAIYGHRSEVVDVGAPSWIEDPTPVIARLKEYLDQPDRDPQAEEAALATDRERRLGEVRQRIAGLPAPLVARFELQLKAAQEATVLQEEHNFWIDMASTYHVRRVLLEFGRRFAREGVIDRPSDVFYLTLAELRGSATCLATGPVPDQRQLVAGRVAEMAYFGTITPPPMLGTLQPGPPPDGPLARLAQRYFGGPPQPSPEPDILRGSPGSPGIVRGPARVVRSMAEAEGLRPGDILVAKTTVPSWTPLFGTVAGVVTDTGGVLSHSAMVAREYRIPAVVGTGMATAVIQDGQMWRSTAAPG